MSAYPCIVPTNASRTRYQEGPAYAEGLYDLGRHTFAWMVPNGSWGEANAGLIVGDGQSLLVDTLWDLDYTQTMLHAMRPLLVDAPLTYLVNTHADGDHWWGNQLVAGLEMITSQASLEEMTAIKPASLGLLKRVGQGFSALGKLPGLGRWGQVGHWMQSFVAPYDFAAVTPTLPTRTFEGGLTLHVGGREVQLIQVGPMHSQGDLMVYLSDVKILFSADALFIDSTPVMWAGPVENWLAALDKILTMEVDLIIPGHGPMTDKAGVRQVKAYWEYVTPKVEEHYQAGQTAQAAARDIALSDDFRQQPFAAWDSPERLMTSAHTMYRNWQGRTGHPKPPELISILRKQALLAHELPQSKPSVMRKKD